MRATEPERRDSRRVSGRPPDEPGRVLVRLVTRLVVAQAIAAAAVGLLFSRRHLPSVLITLAMVAALCALALLVRSRTRMAWLTALAFEVAYIGFGLSRFFAARYVGGTLFAILVAAALAHPAVARAYAIGPRRPREDPQDRLGLGDSAGDACGGQILG